MATHHDRAVERKLRPPDRDLGRSIYAAMGLPVENIGQPGFCQVCGQPSSLAVCYWCLNREARTQYADFLHDQMIFARRSTFKSHEWKCVQQGRDGASWAHSRRGLLVIEGIALEHPFREEDPSTSVRLAGIPAVDVDLISGRPFAVVRSIDGAFEIYRENLDLPPDAEVATLQPDSAEIREAIFAWNRAQGWEWWHHVSMSYGRSKITPSYEDMAFVRDQFITRERESYQVFPPASRYVNLHPAVLHLWHSLEPAHGEAGRVLPQFDGLVMGQRSI